jgi:UDP-glucose 4-epimerase
LTVSENDGTQFLSAAQIAQLYMKLVESDLNEQIFMALGTKFTSWADIAGIAATMSGGYTGRITPPEGEQKSASRMYGVKKMEYVFGLAFAGDEDLPDHIRWNLDWAKAIRDGREIPNPYHVW